VDPVIGVLALQGAFEAHCICLHELGVTCREVRTPADLADVDGLILPGGESTTMSKLLVSSGLFDAIAARLADGMAVFGTCAGMILLARRVLGGRPDQRCFGVFDATVRRNGYGRQLDSFETDLQIHREVTGSDDASATVHGIFIRAPKVEEYSSAVEVLAIHEGVPVLARQGRVLVASFHPELSGDLTVHAMFRDLVIAPVNPPTLESVPDRSVMEAY